MEKQSHELTIFFSSGFSLDLLVYEQGTVYGDMFDQMFQYLRTPVEFELPDWLMKQKMVPYTYIKRSIHGNREVCQAAKPLCLCSH